MNISEMRYLSFLAAAQEIAKRPHEDDEGICRKYAIALDTLTSDEIKMLENMIEEFM